MKEEQLLNYLKANCAGRRNIQTRAQLQRRLGLNKDQLTSLVHRMRCKGLPIAGGPLGYYYAQNAGELLSTIRWLEKMVQTLLQSINGLVKAMEDYGPIERAPIEAQRSGFDGGRRSEARDDDDGGDTSG